MRACALYMNDIGWCKFGYAGTGSVPLRSIPNVIGRPRHRGVMVGMSTIPPRIGNDAITARGILTLKQPVINGIVTNW
jgi:actin-related protein